MDHGAGIGAQAQRCRTVNRVLNLKVSVTGNANERPTEGSSRDRAEEAEIIRMLVARAAVEGGRAPAHEVIETHAARVILAGCRAFKVKKRVKLPFLDFTTLEARDRAIARELELNQPHAPEIYLGRLAITREESGVLAIGGRGPVVDWVLEMLRFDQKNVLSEMAAHGPLPATLCQMLAEMAVRYHEAAPVAYQAQAARLVRDTLMPLLERLNEARDRLGTGLVDALQRQAEASLVRLEPLFKARALLGSVRRCHGDLHLGNIVLFEGRPVPFDALEFNEDLATIDVLYDLAFLLMDLVSRDDGAGANVVFNTYFSRAPLGNEIEGLAALPLFLAMRALVRAVVALARSHQDGADEDALSASAQRLTRLAADLILPPSPCLVAVGGFSGTGKTTLARGLAPHIGAAPGALHVRSDVERKKLFGVSETERLSQDHYSAPVTAEVYRIMLSKAARGLGAGHSVIVDAVLARPDEREALEEIARAHGVRFKGYWLEAPADTLIERVEARRGDASDADGRVVRTQLALKTGPITWQRLNARGDPGETLTHALAALRS